MKEQRATRAETDGELEGYLAELDAQYEQEWQELMGNSYRRYTHRLKLKEAHAHRQGASRADTPYLAIDADLENITMRVAAERVIAKAAKEERLLLLLERRRRGSKQAIRNNRQLDSINQVLQKKPMATSPFRRTRKELLARSRVNIKGVPVEAGFLKSDEGKQMMENLDPPKLLLLPSPEDYSSDQLD